MKITKSQLKQIIKEELESVLSEEDRKIHPSLIQFLKFQLSSHKIKKDGSEMTVMQAVGEGQPLKDSFDEFIVNWQQMYNKTPNNKMNLRTAVMSWLKINKAYK